MKRQDILRRLEERLARGEISEKTYLEIKARYESEPEEPEEPEPTVADIGSTIGAAVAQATQDAGHAAEEAVRAVGEAMRAVEFSGIGARLSDETIKIGNFLNLDVCSPVPKPIHLAALRRTLTKIAQDTEKQKLATTAGS